MGQEAGKKRQAENRRKCFADAHVFGWYFWCFYWDNFFQTQIRQKNIYPETGTGGRCTTDSNFSSKGTSDGAA